MGTTRIQFKLISAFINNLGMPHFHSTPKLQLFDVEGKVFGEYGVARIYALISQAKTFIGEGYTYALVFAIAKVLSAVFVWEA